MAEKSRHYVTLHLPCLSG